MTSKDSNLAQTWTPELPDQLILMVLSAKKSLNLLSVILIFFRLFEDAEIKASQVSISRLEHQVGCGEYRIWQIITANAACMSNLCTPGVQEQSIEF